mmetsp:Transcript_41070/g.46353  ORF Transcript_41070/g.46353 Transcript_41070/m.46353 type:complete len:239 (-) Transcript_41070:89-805(-)
MITFLPSTDFERCARCLDDKRLGAQRYEAYSILKWLRHPMEYPKLVQAGYCKMWTGYELALVRYTNVMLVEWARRGKNNIKLKPYDSARGLDEHEDDRVTFPPWMGCHILHSYHRDALVAKFPDHYQQFGWKESGTTYNGSYMWPVQDDDETGNWILRWPKSIKILPLPVVVEGNMIVGNENKKQTTNATATTKKASLKRMNGEPDISEERRKRRQTNRNAILFSSPNKIRLRSGRKI